VAKGGKMGDEDPVSVGKEKNAKERGKKTPIVQEKVGEPWPSRPHAG